VLQNHNEDNDSDELNEPEWPLDPDFSRTDFAQLRDFAGDSCKYVIYIWSKMNAT